LNGLEALDDTELTRTEGGAKPTIDGKGTLIGDVGPFHPSTGPTFPTPEVLDVLLGSYKRPPG
jgi:hypothetical protein